MLVSGARLFSPPLCCAVSGRASAECAARAVALALVGFFLGPVTPKVLAAIGARVPPSLKGSVVSLLVGTGKSARDAQTRTTRSDTLTPDPPAQASSGARSDRSCLESSPVAGASRSCRPS